MKIKGIKKCISDYNWVRKQGPYSNWHAYIMFDKETKEIWCDVIYGNSYKIYEKESIENITSKLDFYNIEMTMINLQEFIEGFYE